MDLISAGCAVLAVIGVVFFLVYCAKAIDEESRKVENWRR